MNPDRWRKIEEVFHRALLVSQAERAAFIEKACDGDASLCSEVVSLLDSDEASAGKFVSSQVRAAVAKFGQQDGETAIARRVGPYRLVRELGKGGMGTVYLAVRADEQYDSEVAIKLVRSGMDTEFILRRFRRERQILAWLQHPNIARLLDGGTTEDGCSYLVMEYVDGEWITRYADHHRLSVEQRLRLFLPVCEAVEFAHRHFIIHRDLKPGNILVDRYGVPKLLDFGISKLLFGEQADGTETGSAALMTPAYASPEQITGDPVTIVSDVYSLGIVLYELLTGKRAQQIDNPAPLALEKVICQEQPPLPSEAVQDDAALSRRLSGDLDTIVQRAMHKEKERRYSSVGELAADIRRHLEHRPVLARPDSFAYRAGKFVKRNSLAVALGALLGAALVAGTAVSWHQARLASARFEQVRRLAGTFLLDVESAVRTLPGSRHVRQLIARTGLEYLDSLSAGAQGDLGLQREMAAAYERIGDVEGGPRYPNFGDPNSALIHYRRAESLLNEILRRLPDDRQALRQQLSVTFNIGELQRQRGETRSALETFESGLRRCEEALSERPEDLDLLEDAQAFRQRLSTLQGAAGDLKTAMEHASAALRIAVRISVARPEDRTARLNLANAHLETGAALAALGEHEHAIENYRRAVAECEQYCERYPDDTDALRQLMLAYGHLGDRLGQEGAANAYFKAVGVAKRLHEADPSDVRALGEYGSALVRLGAATPASDTSEKAARLRQALELLSRVVRQSPGNLSIARHQAWAAEQLGDVSISSGPRAEAERYYEISLSTLERVLASNPADASPLRSLASAAGKLAESEARTGRGDAATVVLDRLLRATRLVEEGQVSHPSLARSYQTVGSIYTLLSHSQAARDWYQKALEVWKAAADKPGFLPADRKEMERTAATLTQTELPQQRNAQ